MDKTLVFDSNAGNCGCSPLEAAALSNGGFGGANAMLPAMMMGGGFGGGRANPNAPQRGSDTQASVTISFDKSK